MIVITFFKKTQITILIIKKNKMARKKLTDLTEITTISDNAFIHVVDVTDTSQDPQGSSFKMKKFLFLNSSEIKDNKKTTLIGNETSNVFYSSIKGIIDYFSSSRLVSILGFTPYNASNPSGFTANATNAQLRDRATHTGAQAISTVTGLQTALDSKQVTGDYATNATVTNGLTTKVDKVTGSSLISDASITRLANTSGTNTGDQTTITGNAGSATVLQTARTINGVSFNGSSNITINAVDATPRIESSEKGITVATLVGGKVPNDQIPALAISDTFEVSSEAQMLALSAAEKGDVAVRSDINQTLILKSSPSSTLANWVVLKSPTDLVSSVNGQTGVVNLSTSNIAEGSNLYYTEAKVNANANVASNTAKITNANHTGDATGSNALTLATVNANVGTFNNLTVNEKGLVTGASNVVYATGSGSAIGANTGDNATNTQYSGLATSKENTITAGATSQYYRGDKTFQTLDKAAVALANANNTSDENKPISTATQTALNTKISGSGTTNFLTKFTASGTVGNSNAEENNGILKLNNSIGNTAYQLNSNGINKGIIGLEPAVGGGSENDLSIYSRLGGLLFYTNGLVTSRILSNGNFGINQPNPIEKLDVVGNGKFSGTVTASSFNGSANLTGTPTAPTATVGTNTTQIATTSYVLANSGALPYKVYTALLSQSGTNAPVATVLQNTLGGTVVWSYNSAGLYTATLTSAFTDLKTAVLCTKDTNNPAGTANVIMRASKASTSTVIVATVSSTGGVDQQLGGATIEIRVYN
jgi:hypothetical protein